MEVRSSDAAQITLKYSWNLGQVHMAIKTESWQSIIFVCSLLGFRGCTFGHVLCVLFDTHR